MVPPRRRRGGIPSAAAPDAVPVGDGGQSPPGGQTREGTSERPGGAGGDSGGAGLRRGGGRERFRRGLRRDGGRGAEPVVGVSGEQRRGARSRRRGRRGWTAVLGMVHPGRPVPESLPPRRPSGGREAGRDQLYPGSAGGAWGEGLQRSRGRGGRRWGGGTTTRGH